MPSDLHGRLAVLPGTLDLIVLRTLHAMGPQHAYAIATRLQQISEDLLQLNQGTLYPALVRLEQHGLGAEQILLSEIDSAEGCEPDGAHRRHRSQA